MIIIIIIIIVYVQVYNKREFNKKNNKYINCGKKCGRYKK